MIREKTNYDRLYNLIKCAEIQESVDFMTSTLEEQIDMAGGTKIQCSLEYLVSYLIEKGVTLPPEKKPKSVATNSKMIKCKECHLFKECNMGQRCVNFDPNFKRVCTIGYVSKEGESNR